MPKAKKPLPDGSVLLTVFNPYGMPSSFSSILAVTGDERDLRLGVFRWFDVMGITISELFAKRTERAIIVDVRDTKDPGDIERVIGMHKWSEFLHDCPSNFESEVSHIYRCTSPSFEHVELTLGFDMLLDINPRVNIGRLDVFANPYPAPTLPTKWPKAEGPINLYLPPKARPVTPAEVHAFLSGLDLTFPHGVAPEQPSSIPLTSMVGQTDTPLRVTMIAPIEKEGVEPNDNMISPDLRFEMEEEEIFKRLNMNVSERLARYNYEIPSQNMISDIKPSQGDQKAHCKHEDLKPRIASDLDRKPSKSELDELLTRYDRPATAKKEEEAEDVKVLPPVKREYDEDTRESKRHRS